MSSRGLLAITHSVIKYEESLFILFKKSEFPRRYSERVSKIVNMMFPNICILTTNLKSNQKLLETVVQKLLYLTPFACTQTHHSYMTPYLPLIPPGNKTLWEEYSTWQRK